ncbi:MAG: LemA family protein [Clostridium sp. 27_14]|jgi:LemA family protein|nr:MAG: LemA family protein [Clostridium sp. 27_14]
MKNSKIGLIIIAVIAVIAIILIGGYNSIISASEEVENKFSTIDTQLQRRADLIPNLVNTVKGYANQEKEIINTVTTAREKLVGANSVTAKAEADQELTNALSRLLVVVENYPELKSSQNFIQLSDELAGTENRIATARRDYNEAVKTYNLKIKKFPSNVMANMFGFGEKQYFEASEESKNVPNVQF